MQLPQKDNQQYDEIRPQGGDPKRRFENVATALYLVTKHFKEGEPLKIKIRSSAHTVLEYFIELSDISVASIVSHLDYILSLIKIASVTGMISPQNATLLVTEIDAVQMSLKTPKKSAENLSVDIEQVLALSDHHAEGSKISTTQFSDFAFSLDDQIGAVRRKVGEVAIPQYTLTPNPTDLFGLDNSENNTSMVQPFNVHVHNSASQARILGKNQRAYNRAGTGHTNSSLSKNPLVDKTRFASPRVGAVPTQPTHAYSNSQNSNGDQQRKNLNIGRVSGQGVSMSSPSMMASQAKSIGYSERQNIILKEIKDKGQLTIRDLIGKIEGCSEKTIQRELLALVDRGVLQKEGERRWSRYSLR